MKTLVALVLALLIATPTFLSARAAQFKACSKDKKVVVLVTDVDEGAAVDHLQAAFTAAAAQLDAEDLKTYEGFALFASLLDEEDLDAVNELKVPVVLDGESCEVK